MLLLKLMEKLSVGQKRLIAEFLSNIGVGWFAAGVISSFPFWQKSLLGSVVSFLWGTTFSVGFLRIALFFTKGVKT